MIWLVFEHSSWAPKHYILFCGLLILILTKHLISINLLEKCKLRASTTSANPNNSINIQRIASNNNIVSADADEIEATTEGDEEEVDVEVENEEHVNRHSHGDDTDPL